MVLPGTYTPVQACWLRDRHSLNVGLFLIQITVRILHPVFLTGSA